MKAIQRLSDYLKPRDDVIKDVSLPTLLDSIINDDDRLLFSLAVRSGGLGIPLLSEISTDHFTA